MAAKRRSASKAMEGDLQAMGARVVSVFGPFNSRVLIEMPAEEAAKLFPDGFGAAAPSRVIEATELELGRIRRRAEDLADSALAGSAVAMAREIEHPYNSATSKSMCAKELRETMGRLRELMPAVEERDEIDELRDRRVQRAGGARA